MDNTQKQNQPISDDQELAKALAGVTSQVENNTDLQFEETNPTPPSPAGNTPAEDTAIQPPAMPPVADATPATSNAPTSASIDPNLDSIKKDALTELRPLVDKLDVSPEEKYDTYLLLIRSTDDRDLIAPAHEAAKSIQDEARRAQALLDIIKEIDYLSQPPQQQ